MLRETTSRGLSGLVCPSRTSKRVARENPRRPWAGTISVTLLLSAAADLSRRPVRPRAVQGGIFGADSAYLVPALPGHGPVEPHHRLRSSAQDIGRHSQVSSWFPASKLLANQLFRSHTRVLLASEQKFILADATALRGPNIGRNRHHRRRQDRQPAQAGVKPTALPAGNARRSKSFERMMANTRDTPKTPNAPPTPMSFRSYRTGDFQHIASRSQVLGDDVSVDRVRFRVEAHKDMLAAAGSAL